MCGMQLEEDISLELAGQLMRELTGKDSGDVLHHANIERRYPVGCIFQEPSAGETTRRPTSCGFQVKVRSAKCSELSVTLTGHFYVRRRPTLDEQLEHLARQWNINKDEVAGRLQAQPGQRVPLPYCWSYVPFRKTVTVARDKSKEIVTCDDAIQDAWASATKRNVRVVPCQKSNRKVGLTDGDSRPWSNSKDYDEWLDSTFPDNPPSPDAGGVQSLIIESEWVKDEIRVAALNRSVSDVKRDRSMLLLDQTFYGLSFDMSLPEGCEIVPSVKVLEDTFRARKATRSWGEGRNLQVSYDEQTRNLTALPFGILRENRTFPIYGLSNADLSFVALSKAPLLSCRKVLDYLRRMLSEYKSLDSRVSTVQSQDSASHLEEVISRYEDGIRLLESDSKMLKSFELMNETFVRRYVDDNDVTGWRVFQFVYIIGKLPDILKPKKDLFDVIFVPTGGGKTETYFGLIVTAMFYLRFVKINIGTVAIVKFPMRMLAIDQIQRIAPLIALADMVRKEHFPTEPSAEQEPAWMHEFSVGFMIGGYSSRTTPNRVNENSRVLGNEQIPTERTDLRHILEESPSEVQLIFECPVCKFKKHSNGNIQISYDSKEVRAKHECLDCGTRFAVHWTDEECFRYLPTVIISTQDRIAYGAFAPHMRGLFGAPLYVCPEHGVSIYSNACTPFKENGGYGRKSGKCGYLKKKGKLPTLSVPAAQRAVRFIIQDEMHLLRSDLGALDSPFEKMIQRTIESHSGVSPQYIGMSATVQGVQRQVKELYGLSKGAWLFPGDPPISLEASGSPVDAFFEHKERMHRLFVGCMPSFEDPSVVVQRAIDAMTETIAEWERLVRTGNVKSLPEKLRNAHTDALGVSLRQYRMNLGFMNNKVDLERTLQNLVNITNVDRKKVAKVSGTSAFELNVKELTGDNSIMEIREAIKKIKRTSEASPSDPLHVLLATNLVSHGIDLKQMNIMIFYGMPGATSEYIQALSRVGRQSPGVIFVVHHPNRPRDRGLWRTFNQYHMALRQQVEMMPVDHYAPGLVDQTVVTLLRCYWNLIAETRVSADSQSLYKLSQIVDCYQRNGGDVLVKDACKEILAWYEWEEDDLGLLEKRADEYMHALLRYHDRVKGRQGREHRDLWPPPQYADLYRVIPSTAKRWMTTMTGIRGITEGLYEYCDSFSNVYLYSGGIE